MPPVQQRPVTPASAMSPRKNAAPGGHRPRRRCRARPAPASTLSGPSPQSARPQSRSRPAARHVDAKPAGPASTPPRWGRPTSPAACSPVKPRAAASWPRLRAVGETARHAVGAPGQRHQRGPVKSKRQDEPVVVVGVLPHQVHPAWSSCPPLRVASEPVAYLRHPGVGVVIAGTRGLALRPDDTRRAQTFE